MTLFLLQPPVVPAEVDNAYTHSSWLACIFCSRLVRLSFTSLQANTTRPQDSVLTRKCGAITKKSDSQPFSSFICHYVCVKWCWIGGFTGDSRSLNVLTDVPKYSQCFSLSVWHIGRTRRTRSLFFALTTYSMIAATLFSATVLTVATRSILPQVSVMGRGKWGPKCTAGADSK